MRTSLLSGSADLFSRRLTHRQAEPSGISALRHPVPSRVLCRRGMRNSFSQTVYAAQGAVEQSSSTHVGHSSNGSAPLSRTSVVGVLGGGQLGRMLAMDAARLGIKVKVLDPTPNCPASIAADQIQGSFQDFDTVCRFAEGVDVLTVEIEHIDTAAMQRVSDGGLRVEPEPQTLRTIQDKYVQKLHFSSSGVPVADFLELPNEEALQGAVSKFGFPLMLKSKKNAYDGRGNAVAKTEADLYAAIKSLGGFDHGIYAEKWVPFDLELAVMVVRSAAGEIKSFPVVQTIHKDNICHTTETPALVPQSVQQRAKEVAEAAVACLPGAGIFGVEMFLLPDQSLLLNEVAPRPHNSGHYTIEACATSQFENHLRAVLNLPLGDTSLICGSSIMLNILGEADGPEGLRLANEMMERAYKVPGASVHWYGKEQVAKARKTGHITITAPTSQECRRRLALISSSAAEAMHLATYKGGLSSSIGLPSAQPSSSSSGASSAAAVSIIMGSDSDLPTMSAAAQVLEEFGIPCDVTVVSAHRTPERMMDFAKNAHKRGVQVIIAGAGGAAHLPGMVAALTPLPVIGVPVKPSGAHLDGMDALLSIVQMPKGVPVATVAIGNAANAGLLAVRILAAQQPQLLEKMVEYQDGMREMVMGKAQRLESNGWREYKS